MLVLSKTKKTDFDKVVEMLHYTLILSAKNGRYRLKVTNFYFQVFPDSTINNCCGLYYEVKSGL
tara:strand:- start:656 stop:847 length:192 start_codon:yes stop_codon:yes gene_type:complete